MNGAQALMQALSDADVNICFTNPGTTEIHLVAALEDVPDMRVVLGLFEGVCSGAADGYARMSRKPAATLLHLGPGLGNAAANLHNARRARVPVVNLVGDHPVYHRRNDPPLASDIASMAASVSGWVHEARSASELPADGVDAVYASMGPPGQVATLIIPADCAWGESKAFDIGIKAPKPAPAPVKEKIIEQTAQMLTSEGPAILMLGGSALLEPALSAAGRIAQKTGSMLLAHTFETRFSRGAGVPLVRRLPYFPEAAQKRLAPYNKLILAGTGAPTSFFAYPDTSVQLLPVGCEIKALAGPADDAAGALAALEDALGAKDESFAAKSLNRPDPPEGNLTPETAGMAIGALLPENAIVSDEAGTSGAHAYRFTSGAPPHDWLCLTGGSIGQGIPVATGAALACPDRKVLCLQGDGGAMYTIQALWSQARENLDVTTVIFSNRRYQILHEELKRLGFANPGSKITDTMNLDRPGPDWVQLAKGMGVQASRAETAEAFHKQLAEAFAQPGPHLIEAVI
ncbi:MAG: acetolactate synthase large subunit [Desulfosalsimonas sp.]